MARRLFPASFGEATAESERVVAWLRLPAIALIALGQGLEHPNPEETGFLVTLASAVLAGVSYGVWWAFDDVLGDEFLAQVVAVGVALAAGGAAYLGACWLLRVRELRALLALRRGGSAS